MEILKNLQARENSMTTTTDCTSHTHPGPAMTLTTSTTSFQYLMQRPSKDMETPKHKTLNNALVPMNKVLSTTWKFSKDHTPSHT